MVQGGSETNEKRTSLLNRKWFIAVWVIAGLTLVIGGPLVAIFNDDITVEPDAPTLDQASVSADRFLDTYMDGDGRIVRRDQGGDTVSEGQAYGMLVAAALSDRERFEKIWKWSKDNLRQESKLFAWKWEDGRIVDPQPASDADLDMARALSVAATRLNEPRYAEEAVELANAIVSQMVVVDGDQEPVLLAGPWANSAPFYINPSYHSPRAEQELARITGARVWNELRLSQREMIDELDGTPQDPRLPPDWALVQANGDAIPAVSPDRTQQPRYSWDAARTPIRLAESCDQADRDQAAQMWRVLNRSRQSKSAVEMSLSGDVQGRSLTALGSVAGAAGAKSAGDAIQMNNLLDLADRVDANQDTYYGSAWTALGRIMLTTDWLGRC